MNIVLLLTDNCNLRCTYCYYQNTKNRKNGDPGTITGAIDYFYGYAKKMKHDFLNITFFGGEPLLSWDLLKTGVAHAENIPDPGFRFHFAVNTNGTLLSDEKIDYMEEHKFLIYLSLDGVKKTQDSQRPLHNGGGSYDMISPWIPRLTKSNTMVEKVITPENVASFTTDIEFIINRGFRSIITTPDFSGNWTRESFETLEREYKKMYQLYLKKQKRGKALYINLIEDKIKAFLAKKSFKETCCNMGLSIFSVSPEGNIYPCTRFVTSDPGSPFLVGNIKDGIDPKKLISINSFHSKDKPECVDCTIKDRCLGNSCGCVSYSTTGDIFGLNPFVCEHERMITRMADELATELFG
ncbi:MAG: radical SAM protein [Brevinematales bacterium]|nr:radical SAM protein [Brevinematales bacterium]